MGDGDNNKTMATQPDLAGFDWATLDSEDSEPLLRKLVYLLGKRDGTYQADELRAVSRTNNTNVADITTNGAIDEATVAAENMWYFPLKVDGAAGETGVRTIIIYSDAPVNVAFYPFTEYNSVNGNDYAVPHDAATLEKEVIDEFGRRNATPATASLVQRFELYPAGFIVENFDVDQQAVAFSPEPGSTIPNITVQGIINN